MATNIKLMPSLTEKQIRRFWSKVDIKELDECWEWIAGLTNDGYGQTTFQYTQYRPHRIAYFLYYKKDPKELLVCHSCDNPICCNPHHLWLGTLADNMQDRNVKGRSAKGIKNSRAKLTEQQVRQIRKQYIKGVSQTKLGKQYGVGQSMIQCIVNRKNWKHI